MGNRQDWIGYRVVRWRDIAGMTQQELADRTGISREHLSRIENGHKAVTDRRLLYALATALGVSVGDLIDQPTQPRTRHDLAVYSAVPALRGALDDDPDDTEPPDVATLTADVDRAMAARMGCDYPTLAALLPGLVADTRRLVNEGEHAGLGLFVRTAMTAALTVKPFGYVDLAARLAERAQLAAEILGEPAEQAAAAYATAQCALASGTAGGRRRSLMVASAASDQMADASVAGDDAALGWYTMLRLHAALSAASLGLPGSANTHHAEAEAVAGRISSDPWRMEVTSANVAVWRVAIALEVEPDRAPHYARKVNRGELRTKHRQAHLLIHAGRGHYAAGQPEQAVRAFLAADDVAASELRNRPSVHEIVAQMVRDARRRGSSELRDLATRIGIDPLDPPEMVRAPELM